MINLKGRLSAGIKRALTAVRVYLDKWAEFEPLMRLDLAEYRNGLEQKNAPLKELQVEIDRHQADLLDLDRRYVPSFCWCCIPTFFANKMWLDVAQCRKVRTMFHSCFNVEMFIWQERVSSMWRNAGNEWKETQVQIDRHYDLTEGECHLRLVQVRFFLYE